MKLDGVASLPLGEQNPNIETSAVGRTFMTEIEISKIHDDEFDPFSGFQFSKTGRRRRLKTLDVLPNNEGLSYCIMLFDCFVTKENREVHRSSFHSLCKLFSSRMDWKSIQDIRDSGKVFEGSKRISPSIADELAKFTNTDRHVHVRCWYEPDVFTWKAPTRDYLHCEDLLKVLPNPVGEFAISDSHNTWYFFIRDDDPILYFAGPAKLVRKMLESEPKNVLEVPGSMILAN